MRPSLKLRLATNIAVARNRVNIVGALMQPYFTLWSMSNSSLEAEPDETLALMPFQEADKFVGASVFRVQRPVKWMAHGIKCFQEGHKSDIQRRVLFSTLLLKLRKCEYYVDGPTGSSVAALHFWRDLFGNFV